MPIEKVADISRKLFTCLIKELPQIMTNIKKDTCEGNV